MNDATVSFRRPGESGKGSSGTGFGLPPDLLRKSRGRVRLMALFVMLGSGLDVVLMLAGVLFPRQLDTVMPDNPVDLLPFGGNVITLLTSTAVVLASRASSVRDTTLLRTALAFEVFLCLVMSLTNPVAIYRDTGALPHITWVTPLIILFPLIVPCPPRVAVLTAVAAAATRPIGLVVLARSGIVEAPPEQYFALMFNVGLAVVFAYFGSRIVYGLGMEIAQARRLGSYALERLLGRGGMGEVWLARHRMLARPAAVKLVRADLPGARGAPDADVMLARFEREAQATAALRSPHTIGLYDYGVSEEGTFYYVMELLDGLDTDTLVRRFGPVPAERAVHILRAVCHSLAEAHEAGLIHRDIKPANVFVCRYGRDDDFVKVLDFGLVKAIGSADGDAGVTMEGSVRGTPAYMSPEQARGADDVDARSDLYAVGCLAYWLLTGCAVFDGGSALEVLMHHVGTAPVPPSRRTEIPVPESLERIVMECLEKDPARRPASAAELSDRLESCLGGEEWTAGRARRWWARHHPETALAVETGTTIGASS